MPRPAPDLRRAFKKTLAAEIGRQGLLAVVRIPDKYFYAFEKVQREEGRRRLTLAVVLGIVMYLGFLPLVWWTMPDIARLDTSVRAGLCLPYALFTYAIIRRARRHRTQQIAAGMLALIYSLWLCIIVSMSSSPTAPVFITSNSIVIVFVIMMMRLKVALAAILSATIAGIQLVAGLAFGGFSAEASIVAFVINLSIASSGLYALFELNNERRRSFLMSVRDQAQMDELGQRNRDLDRLSETDALTGVLNRRGLDRYVAEHGQNVVATGCLLIDVDNFKPYNDTYGHPAGDHVLERIARTIEGACEPADLVCRYGGEEFAVIRTFEAMPDETSLNAWAETVRDRVARLGLLHAVNPPAGIVTVSIGVAMGRTGQPIPQVVSAADRALYAAKSQGRNRFVNSATMGEAGNIITFRNTPVAIARRAPRDPPAAATDQTP